MSLESAFTRRAADVAGRRKGARARRAARMMRPLADGNPGPASEPREAWFALLVWQRDGVRGRAGDGSTGYPGPRMRKGSAGFGACHGGKGSGFQH